MQSTFADARQILAQAAESARVLGILVEATSTEMAATGGETPLIVQEQTV
jgi:hypothetical protein